MCNNLNVNRVSDHVVSLLLINWNQAKNSTSKIIQPNYPCCSEGIKNFVKINQIINRRDNYQISALNHNILAGLVKSILKMC